MHCVHFAVQFRFCSTVFFFTFHVLCAMHNIDHGALCEVASSIPTNLAEQQAQLRKDVAKDIHSCVCRCNHHCVRLKTVIFVVYVGCVFLFVTYDYIDP